MTTVTADSLVVELRALLGTTITRVRQVTGAQSAWSTPWQDSPAGKELRAEEERRPAPQEGSWPWLLAPAVASWALQVAVEEADGFSAVLALGTTSYAADVLCRGVLETTSLAWWLLDPEINGETRLARSLVYRLNGAEQTERAVKALELEPEESRDGYGELPDDVRLAIESVGLTSGRRTGEERGLFCGEERLPSYTERVAALVAKIWPQRGLPYAQLSAVAHGELLGLQRNLVQPESGAPCLRVARHPSTAMWLWLDTYLVIGGLVFTAYRAASFLGLDEQLAAIDTWTGELDRRLPELRPSEAGDASSSWAPGGD